MSTQRSDTVDRLITNYLGEMIALPNATIADRWLGHYAHRPGSEMLRLTPAENVTVATITSGQGMTHAFAVAADVIAELAS